MAHLVDVKEMLDSVSTLFLRVLEPQFADKVTNLLTVPALYTSCRYGALSYCRPTAGLRTARVCKRPLRDHSFLGCGAIHFKSGRLRGAGGGGDILQDDLGATAGRVKDIEPSVQDAVELVGHVLQSVSLEEEGGGREGWREERGGREGWREEGRGRERGWL